MLNMAMPVRSFAKHEATSDEEQWTHYLGLCGSWTGTWQRYSADPQGALTEKANFCAICAPMVSADGQSVQHKNSYPAEALPAGKEARSREDGLSEVDYGIFTKANFQQPFGPQSTALYGPGFGVIAPASFSKCSTVAAVELISCFRGQRCRLVAMWRVGEESATVATLQSVTTVLEVAQGNATSNDVFSGESMAGDTEGWYHLRSGLHALLPRRLSLGQSEDVEIGLSWKPDGQNGPSVLVACFCDGALSELKATG